MTNLYRRKPVVVHARKVTTPTTINIGGSPVLIKPGHYIILDDYGLCSVCPEEIFEEEYDLIPDEWTPTII